MNSLLGRFSRLVTARPYFTLIVLLMVTVVLAAGRITAFRPRRAPAWHSFRPGIQLPMRRKTLMNSLRTRAGSAL